MTEGSRYCSDEVPAHIDDRVAANTTYYKLCILLRL